MKSLFITSIFFITIAVPALAQKTPKGPPVNHYAFEGELKDVDFNKRRMMLFRQIIGRFQVRNMDASYLVRDQVDEIVTKVTPPNLHADLPPEQIEGALRAAAKDFLGMLDVEVKRGVDSAVANKDYLSNRFLPNLKNRDFFSWKTNKEASAELNKMLTASDRGGTCLNSPDNKRLDCEEVENWLQAYKAGEVKVNGRNSAKPPTAIEPPGPPTAAPAQPQWVQPQPTDTVRAPLTPPPAPPAPPTAPMKVNRGGVNIIVTPEATQ